MSTIPASAIVNVTPNVLAAGGSALDLSGLVLTTSSRPPIGSVPSFPTATAVGNYFGSSSTEKTLADKYFSGFENSDLKPGALLFAQYNTLPVAAFVRGGSVADMTLAQLQALNALFAVTVDGALHSGTVSLSGATSFSGAAQGIADSIGILGQQTASAVGSIAGNTLTVTSVSSGSIEVGNVLSGTGITSTTFVTGFITGTGGAGTYSVTPSQTRTSAAFTSFRPGMEFDSVTSSFLMRSGTTGAGSTITFGSGPLATALRMTLAAGAVISQGAVAAAPGAFMDHVVATTQNWASFMTEFNPDVTGNANKLLFANWVTAQDKRFLYAAWDTDLSPTTTVPATTSLGVLVADFDGVCPIFSTDTATGPLIAAFLMGAVASIDFGATEGRTNLAFRRQSGLVADVTDQTIASNLIANGYNFYGAYGTANDEFVWFYDGSVSGDFRWLDSYVNQIWLNNAFQLALMTLLQNEKSIPYNTAGYGKIETALLDPIVAGLNTGVIRVGVDLSAQQAADVNGAAGLKVDKVLENQGWYLQVSPATAQVRAERGSPPCKFWYMDGQSVQQINLTSVNVQ